MSGMLTISSIFRQRHTLRAVSSSCARHACDGCSSAIPCSGMSKTFAPPRVRGYEGLFEKVLLIGESLIASLVAHKLFGGLGGGRSRSASVLLVPLHVRSRWCYRCAC
mmetsp:Transcript_131021/g.419980  ORF Transcript_131021/g.419980 Transcript_131021/m.419980 type:complete len:108 (+) Transcript_131021:165-488(+)